MKIDHIGYVVKDLDKSCEFYCSHLDYKVKVPKLYVANQSVEIIMLESRNFEAPNLELIHPSGDHSPVRNALNKKNIINHICYKVQNYDDILSKFSKKIVRKSMPAPVELFNGGRTFFAYLDGQVTEFLEDIGK